MKRLLAVLLVSIAALTGCGDGMTDRERTCMELSGDVECLSEARRPTQGFGPSAPGEYTNYYGSPQHGSWGSDGQYRFHNPHGQYASSTNSFLLGAAAGGLAAYMLTKNANRSNWSQSNPNGYQPKTRTNTKYIGKGGKEISKAEYQKRKAQSKKAKAANKAKADKAAKLKAKKAAKLKAKKAAKAKAKKAAKAKAAKNASKPKLDFTKPSAKKKTASKPKKKTTYKKKSTPKRKKSKKRK